MFKRKKVERMSTTSENVCGGAYINHGESCLDCVRFMDDCDGATGWFMTDEDDWVEDEE